MTNTDFLDRNIQRLEAVVGILKKMKDHKGSLMERYLEVEVQMDDLGLKHSHRTDKWLDDHYVDWNSTDPLAQFIEMEFDTVSITIEIEVRD